MNKTILELEREIDEYKSKISNLQNEIEAIEDTVEYDLSNFDLIQEVGQLESYIAIAQEKAIVSDTFNHCMLEDVINTFEQNLEDAYHTFASAVRKRLSEVYEELNKRGVINVEFIK